MAAKTHSIFDPAIIIPAIGASFQKLNPAHMLGNPVMFVTEVGAMITTALLFIGGQGASFGFLLQITLWLWFTVIFANFAEAMAEGRGKAQAETLRKSRTETKANRFRGDGAHEEVPSNKLRKGDVVIVKAGEFIPGDGEIVEGAATVDESAITGESAPVVREAGGDRSAVTGGTRVLSDEIKIRITSNPGETFLDRMIGLVEGAKRQKTPNEIALTILLSALTMSGRAVEAAGDVDVLLLDKTGTITLGNRQAAAFVPVPGVSEQELAEAAQLSSLADETPEGRSIVVLAKQKYGIRGRELHEMLNAKFVPFSAHTRMSGVDYNGESYRKGAAGAIRDWVGGQLPKEIENEVEAISNHGGTPLVVAMKNKALGVIYLKDIVKGGLSERFERFRAIGIRTVMITGDNPLTAAAIAKEAGVDDFLAQATPEDKLALIRKEQEAGHLVAMTGDGTNDAPALAQADVGVAMNTGTQAAKEAGNMVDLDSNPTKLLEVVEIGKQLLITRGALTTFSIANDVAKYFAIIPAMLLGTFPLIAPLNVMRLQSPTSPILSAVIFNALVIIALVPLALRGVKFRPLGAARILRRNLLIYGLGGILIPFIGIKMIDMIITAVQLA